MKQFMGEDFLLSTKTAQALFAKANAMPIFDWHCHLSPKEIYENRPAQNITELWLAADHYKWRAMRSFGVSEDCITGNRSPEEKFKAWAATMPYMIGNPLYHWAHLELQRYFGITEPLSEKTADSIWKQANAVIAGGGFSPRELIARSKVNYVCTTDDPADSLEYHKLLAQDESFACKVLPAFRPDKALNIELASFIPWVRDLEQAAGMEIRSYIDLKAALAKRIAFFAEMGCRATDCAVSYVPCVRATECQLDEIFKKGLRGAELSVRELDMYRTELMRFLAKEYYARGWGMEIHIGPMRNNNALMYKQLGPDAGFDSVDDRELAQGLSRFLDSLAEERSLPKTVLFTINPKDNYVLGTMLGNFQTDEAVGKMQFGSAWWFNDNIDGMREQMKAFANLSVLGGFIGMVTDSRSFLSYPRHEYFRRILCEFLGNLVENGEYPADMEMLTKIVEDISYNNAVRYFGVEG